MYLSNKSRIIRCKVISPKLFTELVILNTIFNDKLICPEVSVCFELFIR